MRKHLPLAIISLILLILTTAVSSYMLYEAFNLPPSSEDLEMGESIGRGLTLLVCLLFFIGGAILNAIAFILSLIGFILTKRSYASRGDAPRGVIAWHGIQAILAVVLSIIPFLLLPL